MLDFPDVILVTITYIQVIHKVLTRNILVHLIHYYALGLDYVQFHAFVLFVCGRGYMNGHEQKKTNTQMI